MSQIYPLIFVEYPILIYPRIYLIIASVKGRYPEAKRTAPGASNTEDGTKEGGGGVRYHDGAWYYQGVRYASLHDALVATWPK